MHWAELESHFSSVFDSPATQGEAMAIVEQAMMELPERQREVINLYTVEALSLSEIADVLGITGNTAKVNLCQARKKVRRAFQSFQNSPSIRENRMTSRACQSLDEVYVGRTRDRPKVAV